MACSIGFMLARVCSIWDTRFKTFERQASLSSIVRQACSVAVFRAPQLIPLDYDF
jgi:hypothetical protein